MKKHLTSRGGGGGEEEEEYSFSEPTAVEELRWSHICYVLDKQNKMTIVSITRSNTKSWRGT